MAVGPGRCPSCERFIGPLDACPFCDTPAQRLASLRLLRALALLLATGGLALLALYASRREPARVRLADITPAMNGARIRAVGTVAAPPRSGVTRQGSAWLGFTLEQDQARLRVNAYEQAAETLLAEPAALEPLTRGAPVEVTGKLLLRAGQPPALVLRDPGDLRPGLAP